MLTHDTALRAYAAMINTLDPSKLAPQPLAEVDGDPSIVSCAAPRGRLFHHSEACACPSPWGSLSMAPPGRE